MTLIKSISGIRGTIGGKVEEGLNPLSIARFTCAFARYIREHSSIKTNKIVVGRDARISGPMVRNVVVGSLMGMGYDVVDIDLATTPTTEIAVVKENAEGGVIITASHNPKQWNALKLLNERGEFLSASSGAKVLEYAQTDDFDFPTIDCLGTYTMNKEYKIKHIQEILALTSVDVEAIKQANFSVAIDCVNSVGGIFVPDLLYALGVKKIHKLHCAPHGNFSHNPEPIPENLTEISDLMSKAKIDVGFVVDPDVDRLAIICEDGTMFGEEYTLVSIADYILSKKPGNTVSNLSSTRALRDVTEKHGGKYFAAAVGEVNVVAKMKEVDAVIGGEGNGGVILPDAHYGRDALVGIALFLSLLAHSKKKVSELKATYPAYFIAKKKIDLDANLDPDLLLKKVEAHYAYEQITTIDGVKIDFADAWVHLRKSNTEPILRVYSEAYSEEEANRIGDEVLELLKSLMK